MHLVIENDSILFQILQKFVTQGSNWQGITLTNV